MEAVFLIMHYTNFPPTKLFSATEIINSCTMILQLEILDQLLATKLSQTFLIVKNCHDKLFSCTKTDYSSVQ